MQAESRCDGKEGCEIFDEDFSQEQITDFFKQSRRTLLPYRFERSVMIIDIELI